MVPSDSDSDSSEEVTSVDNHVRPVRRPPLIPDFQGMRTPSPANGSPVSRPYPSSFARTASPKPIPRAVPSASKSDIGHFTAGETRAPVSASANPGSSPAAGSRDVPINSSFQTIKPGQYSDCPSPLQIHTRPTSGDTWSNTHSATHSRQNSGDRLEKAKSELGHGSKQNKTFFSYILSDFSSYRQLLRFCKGSFSTSQTGSC
jgi:hypothetical protein